MNIVESQNPDVPAFDSDTIPPAVKARIRSIEALYQAPAVDVPPTADVPPDAPSAPVVERQAPEEPPPSVRSVDQAPAASQPADTPDDADSWKHRALAFEGRFNQAKKDLGDLQAQYFNEVAQQRQAAPPPPPPQQRRAPPPPPKQFITPEDAQNYGTDFLDVSQRAAMQAVAPFLDQLRQENQDLRARHARDSRAILDSQVAAAVPDFMEIDRNPRWHNWLLGIDTLSGRMRQQLLNEAISAGNAPRVVAFFNGFRAEEARAGQTHQPSPSPAPQPPRAAAVDIATLASPGRARTASSGETAAAPAKPVYTRPQITQLYEQHRRGAYIGREAEWTALERDIFAAQHDGRIRVN